MNFKIVPTTGPRYWVSITIASICGANMGDFIPDVLKLGDLSGLLMLAMMFAIIVLGNRWSKHGHEALYWLAILVIRAAATNLADLAIGGSKNAPRQGIRWGRNLLGRYRCNPHLWYQLRGYCRFPSVASREHACKRSAAGGYSDRLAHAEQPPNPGSHLAGSETES